jgi:type I restriction enzyme M protein
VGVRETDTEVADRVRDLFADARRRDPSIFAETEIDLPDNKIRDVVQTIQEVGLSLMPIDGLGHAFEHFFSTIFRGDLGQYFTRRELVRFMVAMVEPNGQDFVIDPTSGSGGFLLEALMQVWRYIDLNFAGQTDVERQKYDFAHENLFGIEANDILGRVCQTNLLLHKDGHTNIETNRTCLDISFSNSQIRPDGTLFTLVLGNPPFGSDVEEGDEDDLGSNTLGAFELGRGRQKIKSELVILERSFQFLRPGGRLAMVVPDGLLNNAGGESRTFRRYWMHTARIDAVVSLPDHAFRKSGAQNKTSILFATKFTEDEQSRFQQAYAEEVNRLAQANEAQPQLGSDVSSSVEVESKDDNSELAADEKLMELELSARAMQAVLRKSDYHIFLAEADQIGYSPAGAPLADNDLNSIVNDMPDAQDKDSILGQYARVFRHAPATYRGTEKPQCMAIRASDLFTAHPTYRIDPKSHLFEREQLSSAPPGMKRVRLGEILQRREERVRPALEPDREFLVPTLTQEGDLTPREAGQGNTQPAWFGQYFKDNATWYRLHTENLVYSRIDLWKGCVTVVPEEYDGAIVTNEFPVYEVDREQLDPHYLKLVLRTAYFQHAIRAITTGHSNRRRTQADDFENLMIFVPEDRDMQLAISEVLRESEQAVVQQRMEYRELSAALDNVIIGEVQPEEFLSAHDR